MEKTKFYLVQRDKYKWESMLQKIGFKAADDLGESRCDTVFMNVMKKIQLGNICSFSHRKKIFG